MEMEQWLVLAVVLISLVLSIYGIYSRGEKLTAGTVVTAVGQTLGQVDELTKAAREAVQAAEQLWEKGQIPEGPDGTKHPKFYYALGVLQKWFPNLDEAVLEAAIEGAVFWLKHIAPSFMAVLPVGMQGNASGTPLNLETVPVHVHGTVIDSGDSGVVKPTPESLQGLSPQ